MIELRTVWVICTVIMESKNPKPKTDDAKVIKAWEDSFAPCYQVCTTRIELERKIRHIDLLGMCWYSFTEVKVEGHVPHLVPG